MSKKKQKPFLSTVEAARRLGVSRWTVRNYIRAGKIQATQPGSDFRIPISEIERLSCAFDPNKISKEGA